MNQTIRAMEDHTSKGKSLPLWGLLMVILAFYLISGWGYWGYSVISDYTLDTCDAIRISQGDIPYRDFIPTYGALYMYLTAPLFRLGQASLSSVWILTSILILGQWILLRKLTRNFLSPFWGWALLGLMITSVSFIPSNSKFILGYSPSGFLASLLFTLGLFFLHRKNNLKHWGLAGLSMGLIPFTKIDLGFTSVALLALIFWIQIRSSARAVFALSISYGLIWSLCCLLLFLNARSLNLLIGSTLETFGQIGFFTDFNLARRLKLLLLSGGILLFALLWKSSRPWILKSKKMLHPILPLMIPTAILFDAARSYLIGSIKNMVLLDWTWMAITILIGTRLILAVIRTRSLKPLRSKPAFLISTLMVLSGMGFLRVLGSGWYPLNYFQPGPVVLGIFWSASFRSKREGLHPFLMSMWIFTILVQGVISLQSCRQSPYPLDEVSSPYGKIVFPLGTKIKNVNLGLIQKMKPIDPNQYLLCTYEPSLHLLTGMRFCEIYTFFTHVGLAGSYQNQREKEALALIIQSRPLYIYQDREVGKVHCHFGTDFGLSTLQFIHKNYTPIEQTESHTFYRLNSP